MCQVEGRRNLELGFALRRRLQALRRRDEGASAAVAAAADAVSVAWLYELCEEIAFLVLDDGAHGDRHLECGGAVLRGSAPLRAAGALCRVAVCPSLRHPLLTFMQVQEAVNLQRWLREASQTRRRKGEYSQRPYFTNTAHQRAAKQSANV